MNVSRIRRLAVSGVATAIAAAGLVGASSTAATAATGHSVYNCTNGLLPSALPIPVSVDGTLPPSVTTGFPVPPNLLNVNVSFTAPAAVLAGLAPYGATQVGMSSDNFNLRLNNTEVPITGVGAPLTDVVAGQDLVLPSTASVGQFVVPSAGPADIKMPAKFDMNVLTNSTQLPSLPLSCSIADETTSEVTAITIDKQTSTTTAKAPKAVKKGQRARATANVAGAYKNAAGKVVVKELKNGKLGKALASAKLKAGKAALTLPALKPGKHVLSYIYAGNSQTIGSSFNKTLKVTR